MSQTEPPIELSELEVALRMMVIQVRADALGFGIEPKSVYTDPIIKLIATHQDQAVKDEAYIAFGIASVSKSLVDFQNDYAKHIENLEANNTGGES